MGKTIYLIVRGFNLFFYLHILKQKITRNPTPSGKSGKWMTNHQGNKMENEEKSHVLETSYPVK